MKSMPTESIGLGDKCGHHGSQVVEPAFVVLTVLAVLPHGPTALASR